MATIDITSYIRVGSKFGIVMELDNGNLVSGSYSPFVIAKSTDKGLSWVTKYNGGEVGSALLAYIDSRGYIYYGNFSVSASEYSKIIRSTDGGENWSVVMTSESNGMWRMAEDSQGNLYASEYSSGDRGPTELFAYNLWRSTNGGATWSKYFSYPPQSDPGVVKDSIRHIHLIAVDSNDNKYISAGDATEFAGESGNTYQLTSAPALGTLMSSSGNGWISFVEADNGNLLFGHDGDKVIKYTRSGNVSTEVADMSSLYGSAYGSPIYDLVKGKDGVIYACNNNESGSQRGGIYASPDDGVTWHNLNISGFVKQGLQMKVNRNRPGSRVYLNRAANYPYISFPDFTRQQLNSFVSGNRIRRAVDWDV